MKKFASFALSAGTILLGLTAVLLPDSAFGQESFFESSVIGKTEAKMLMSEIKIGTFCIKNTADVTRYSQAKFFLSKVKQETVRQYESGEMNEYQLRDTASELSNLAYTLNQYFRNIQAFERTGNKTYRNLASQNLRETDMAYGRLNAVTIKISRR